jgi:phage shock protein A
MGLFNNIASAVNRTANQVRQTVQNTANQARQTVQNTANQVRQNVQRTADTFENRVQSTAQQVRQNVQHTADGFEDRVRDAANQARQTVQNTANQVRQNVQHTVQQAQQTAQQVQQTVQHTVQQAQQTTQQVADRIEQKANEIIQTVKDSPVGQAAKPVVDLAVATAESVAQEVGLMPTPEQPILMRDHRETGSYSQVPGQLFVDGAGRDDIRQGGAGDCYYLATLSSIAESHPEVIQNAIRDNGNGTYTVTFQVPVGFEALEALGPAGGLLMEGAFDTLANAGINLPTRPVEITVDGSLPLDANGNPLYSGTPNGEQWVPIMEKAYAQLWGSYADIGNGGSPATAMRLLTGGNVESHTLANPLNNNPLGVKVVPVKPSEAQQEAVFNNLKAALDSDKIVVAGTYGTDLVQGQQGLVPGHAYSVVDTVEENGEKYVVLRNPWGSTEVGNDGNNEGVFRMPVEDFIKNFASYDVGEVK